MNFFKQLLIIILSLFLLFIQSINCDCLIDCCQTLTNREKQRYYFYQNTGHFFGGQGEWQIDTYGYSGKNKGMNNPLMQCVSNVGPLPINVYTVAFCQNTITPCAFYLSPNDQSRMCGRWDMFIHGCKMCTEGDTTVPPTLGCSEGCLIINVQNRQKIRIGDEIIVISNEKQI